MGLRDAGRQMLVRPTTSNSSSGGGGRWNLSSQQATESDFTAVVVTDNDTGRNNDCGLSWSDWSVNR